MAVPSRGHLGTPLHEQHNCPVGLLGTENPPDVGPSRVCVPYGAWMMDDGWLEGWLAILRAWLVNKGTRSSNEGPGCGPSGSGWGDFKARLVSPMDVNRLVQTLAHSADYCCRAYYYCRNRVPKVKVPSSTLNVA